MKKLRITVGKKTYDVTVEVLSDDSISHSPPKIQQPPIGLSQTPQISPAVTPAARGPVAPGSICSPMAGTVKKVLVKAGDEVRLDQPLVILDAMKMENRIMASSTGTVKSVLVKEGESVGEGQALLVLE